jgi:hypothetical protein
LPRPRENRPEAASTQQAPPSAELDVLRLQATAAAELRLLLRLRRPPRKSQGERFENCLAEIKGCVSIKQPPPTQAASATTFLFWTIQSPQNTNQIKLSGIRISFTPQYPKFPTRIVFL